MKAHGFIVHKFYLNHDYYVSISVVLCEEQKLLDGRIRHINFLHFVVSLQDRFYALVLISVFSFI